MKVLVVVDAQNDFIDGALGSEEAKKVLPNITEKIKTYGGVNPIILTYDTHNQDYLKTQEGKFLPVEHCILGTDGFEVHKDIIYALGRKYRMAIFKNTFGSKHLPILLEQCSMILDELESIELVGYVLDICVISNALLLKAYYPEVPIYVDTNCCSATSKEAFDAAVTILKSCQINVV